MHCSVNFLQSCPENYCDISAAKDNRPTMRNGDITQPEGSRVEDSTPIFFYLYPYFYLFTSLLLPYKSSNWNPKTEAFNLEHFL